MMNLEKAVMAVQKTPFIGWKKLNYSAPSLLTGLYSTLADILISLAEKAIDKRKYDNRIKPNHHWRYNDEYYQELTNDIRNSVQQHLYAAGGYPSDFIISKIHSVPFNPKDIDIFIDQSFIDPILSIFSVSSPVRKNKNAKTEFDKEKYLEVDLDPFLFEVDSEFEETVELSKWNVLGEVLKRNFPDCAWKDSSESGYHFTDINVVYRFTFEGTPVEIIIGNDNRILNFDLSFRSAYFIRDTFYINELGLKDIQNKTLRIFHSNTPYSTLVRLYNFKERLGYQIDEFSLMLLFSSLKTKDIQLDTFLSCIRTHKKYTEKIEEDILSNPHFIKAKELTFFEPYLEKETIIDFNGNSKEAEVQKYNSYKEIKNFITFKIDHFPQYRPGLGDLYENYDLVFDNNNSSILYSKVEAFLTNIDGLESIYERPKDLCLNEIFAKGVEFSDDFAHWVNQKKLIATFDFNRLVGFQLTTETLDVMYNLVMYGPDSVDVTTDEYKSALSHLPVILRNNTFKLDFSTLFQMHSLIHENVLHLTIHDPYFEHELTLYVDSDNKILKIGKLPGYTYFGLVGELFDHFLEHIQAKLGFSDYKVETLWDYAYYQSNNTYYNGNTTPITLMNNVEEKYAA